MYRSRVLLPIYLCMGATCCPLDFWVLGFGFLLFIPCAPPRSVARKRRFGRALMKQLAIRLSWQTTPAKSLVMFEHAVRVPQPPEQSSNAGHPAGAANRGGFFFGSFLLAAQKKGTSCRATPGGVCSAQKNSFLLHPLLNPLPQAGEEVIVLPNPSQTATPPCHSWTRAGYSIATPPAAPPHQVHRSYQNAVTNAQQYPDIHPD